MADLGAGISKLVHQGALLRVAGELFVSTEISSKICAHGLEALPIEDVGNSSTILSSAVLVDASTDTQRPSHCPVTGCPAAFCRIAVWSPRRCWDNMLTCACSRSFSWISALFASRVERSSSTTSAKEKSAFGASEAKKAIVRAALLLGIQNLLDI
eukprot:5225913-Pleurochrysis_carterae.AAC.1